MFGPLIVLDVIDAFVVSGDNDKLKLLIDVTGRIQPLVFPSSEDTCRLSARPADVSVPYRGVVVIPKNDRAQML
jgi:hypothetical protein